MGGGGSQSKSSSARAGGGKIAGFTARESREINKVEELFRETDFIKEVRSRRNALMERLTIHRINLQNLEIMLIEWNTKFQKLRFSMTSTRTLRISRRTTL